MRNFFIASNTTFFGQRFRQVTTVGITLLYFFDIGVPNTSQDCQVVVYQVGQLTFT